jgi:hypothetical protein
VSPIIGTELGTSRSATIPNLHAGTVYTLKMRALSPDGASAYTEQKTFTPLEAPKPAISLNVSIPSPAAGIVTINAGFVSTAGGSTGSVAFRIDGVLLGTDTTAPYTFAVDTKKYENGTHVVHVQATTTQNGVVVVSGKSFTTANVPRSIALSGPALATYDTNATFTAKISGSTQANLLMNQHLTLQRLSGTTWTDVVIISTDTTGTAKLVDHVLTPATYRVKWGTILSPTVVVKVTPVLKITYTKASGRVYFKGTLLPALGQFIALQRIVAGKWTAITGTNSPTFALDAWLPEGSTQWRFTVAATTNTPAITSQTYTLTR